MDRRFNSENFEKSLKAHADEFKMMPSKKVWRGIYNDLHPGTRWPSVAMSLVFIFTLVIIGHLNTNNYKILATLNASQKSSIPVNINKKKIKNHTSRVLNNNTQVSNNSITDNTTPFSPHNISSSDNNESKFNFPDAVVTANQSFASVKSDKNIVKNGVLNTGVTSSYTENKELLAENNLIINAANNTEKRSIIKENDLALNKKSLEQKQQIKKVKEVPVKQEEKISGSSFLSKKVRDKISVNFYLSPSISYRNLSERSFTYQNTTASPSANFANPISNNSVINKPIIGLEVGIGFNYKLSRRWQATSGVQMNYGGYNIKANNVHPVSTNVLLIDDFTGAPYAFNATSNYGIGSSTTHVTIHQYSFQASIPFGLKYMIAENNNLQFNVEGTFQPSYIIAGKAYLLSSDKRNYVTEPSLVRNFNMSTNMGTFISFKSNTFKWQIGPQVFYQLLSTYSHDYPTQEHLINYGIRFGVSKLKN